MLLYSLPTLRSYRYSRGYLFIPFAWNGRAHHSDPGCSAYTGFFRLSNLRLCVWTFDFFFLIHNSSVGGKNVVVPILWVGILYPVKSSIA